MKSRLTVLVLMLIAFGAGAGAGTLGLLWATGGNATPSRDAAEVIRTLSLEEAEAPSLEAIGTQIAELNTKVDALGVQIAALTTGDTSAVPTPAFRAIVDEVEAVIPVERALFALDDEESRARFYIDEDLLGRSIVVVGETRRVAGEIIVNFTDPAASEIGEIAINVRTLRTDNEFRDQAIRGQILQSSQDAYEFVIFRPTQVIGLDSEGAQVGDVLKFQIEGELQVRDVTRTVMFEAEVTIVSETRLEGIATTQIAWEEYGLTINAPPQVANIGDTVTLELDFVALATDK